ncbi:MAG TPA: hypothetical protein VJP79_05105, partial [Nitrososphaera sp.]|nr:hypothetical protein [Nitrososphaera sp.]
MAAKRRGRQKSSSSSKKIVAYAAIGIIALAAVSVTAFAPKAPAPVSPEEQSRQQALMLFQDRFCGAGGQTQSTNYLTEFGLPSSCEMPLAIEATGGKVWYVSTKNGTLGSYNTAEGKFDQEQRVPSWPTRDTPVEFSMSWSAKADGNGNIWLTDERQRALWRFDVSEQTFEMYPVSARLPVSIDFDSQGMLYFAGVQSTSIFIGDPAKMKNGTSDGITEVPLPLDGFSSVDKSLVATGSLVVDRQNNKVWVSLLAFEKKGQLFRYDIDSAKIDRVVDLPDELTSPVGLALDDSGKLWVTDHGTNVFFSYDQDTGDITKFVTSVASPRIYAGRDLPKAYT